MDRSPGDGGWISGACDPPPETYDLTLFLADCATTDPGMLDRLLAAHTCAGTGDCRTCGGPQSGRDRWPCHIHASAMRAKQLRQEQQ